MQDLTPNSPQVYARLQDGDLTPNGALLAANSIDLQVGGDLTTSGSIAGRQIVSLSAENLSNLRGRIAGQSVGVAARNDLTLDGGTISAQDRLIAAAGNNLTVKSSTADLEVRLSGTPSFVNSRVIDRVAGLYVSGPDALLVASAGNDLKIMGGVVQNSGNTTAAGGGGTALVAGNNLTLGTVVEASNSYAQAKNSWRKEQKTNEVGSLIQTTGDLTLVAGNDLTARAASVASGGALTAQAGNDLLITAGEATYDMASYRKIKKSGFASSTTKINRDAEQSTRALSSLLSGEGVTLEAGQDVLLRGSAVSAQGDLALSATRDITLDSAQDTLQETHFRSVKKSGFSMSSLGAISYGNSALKQNAAGQSVTQVGSTLSGANVTTASGRDTTIKASTVIADNNLTLLAGRNVDILAAANAQNVETQTKSSSTSIGLTTDISGRITTFGKTKASEDVTGTAISQSTSLLSANAGDLTIRAGLDAQYKGSGQGNITTQGADLLAGQTIALSGNAIDLQAVENQSTSHSLTKTSSFTIGARPAGFWGEKIAAIGDAVERAQNTDNDRLKGALALKAGYDAWKIYQGQKPPTIVPTGTETSPGSGTSAAASPVKPMDSNSGGTVPGSNAETGGSANGTSGFGIQVYLGSSKSKSETSTRENTVSGTNLQAKTIDIAATETDLTMNAAKLQAENISLSAQRDILLQAAANTSELTSRNSGSSTGLGVTFAFGGQQNGLSFQISASRMKGKADGSETIWDNTLVTASDTLSVSSGRDTTLRGAQVAGQSVLFDVGGKLLVETLQDNSLYASKQTSSGFNLSICWFFCAGTPVTGSIGASSQSIKHNYLSAVGQSGIAAGEGGFDISVMGGTELIGAALTSSAQTEKNRLSTASLTSRDLDNAQRTKASSSSISLAYGGGSAMATMAGNATANLLGNLNGNAALPKNQNETSQTQSVISPATITLTGSGNAETDAASRETIALLTSRDPATANGSLTNTLSLQQAQVLEREIVRARENQEAAQMVGAVLANVVGDVAASRKLELQKQENARAEAAGESPRMITAWGEGSVERVALHGMVGLIEAKIGNGSVAAGALGGMTYEALIPAMTDYLNGLGFNDSTVEKKQEFDALMNLGSTLLGTAVGTLATGNVNGASVGANVAFIADRNNRQLHPTEQNLAKELVKKSNGKYTEQEIADALRWANNLDLNETPLSHIVVPLNADTQAGEIYDAQSMSLANSGGQALLYQNLSGITPPSGDLMAFIQQNTGGTYSWNTAAWQAVPQTTFTQNGTRYGMFSANGQTFALPLADCPASGCATSPIAWASTSSADQAALQAYATAAGIAMTSFVSRTAGVVGSTATTVAAIPGPHQPVAAGTAVIATGVGIAADAVEALIQKNPATYVKTQLESGIPAQLLSERFPMFAPLINEVAERIKSRP